MSKLTLYNTEILIFEALISEWVKSSNKPYLKENITLSTVARELKISPRLLSEYLNTILGLNFNTWINTLRINEVKKLMSADKTESLTEIAYKTGFSDLAAMSKIFKRLQGETPTAYRSRIQKNNS